MKKFLTGILISVIFLGSILAPFGAKTVRAEIDSSTGGGSMSQLNVSGTTNVASSDSVSLTCGFTNLKACLAVLGNATMSLTARALWITGILFDSSLDYSLNLNKTLAQLQVVDRAWGVGRDVANMFFIFILLFIAIATILQIEQYGAKTLLVKVIIVAVLINFSLVITKVVIDTSNILAASFYNQMTANGGKSISTQYMKGLQLESVYDVGQENNDAMKITSGNDTTYGQIVTITFFGSIFILVVAFVFFAGAVMFFIRTIILVFLLILSPLAFIASILPSTSQYANKWWNMLFDQSFFAPAFLFLNYAVLLVVNGGRVSLSGASEATTAATNVPFSAALVGSQAGSLDIIFNFAILIGMIIAALVVAKSMGAYGAETMIKWGQATRKAGQGFVGRHTLGRAAAVVAGAETTKRILGAVPGGRYVSQGLNVVAGASFGGAKGGYTGAVKKTAERQAAYGEYLGKGKGGAERQATYVKSLEGGAAAKTLRTYTGIGMAGPQAAKTIEKNTAKQSAKKNKEAELAKLEEEHKKLEEIPKEKDETRVQELKVDRTLTANPGAMANINDEIAEINKRRERRVEVLNRINDLRDKLEMAEKIDKLSDEVGKGGGASSGDKGKPSK